jgi:hypothetical protein
MLKLMRIAAVVAGGLALVTAPVSHAAPFTSGSFAFTADTSASTDVTTATDFHLFGPAILPTIGFDDFAGAPLPAFLSLPAGAVNFNLVAVGALPLANRLSGHLPITITPHSAVRCGC